MSETVTILRTEYDRLCALSLATLRWRSDPN